MVKALEQVQRSYVARATLLLSGGDVLAKGAVFATQMVLARRFDAEAMGSLSFCLMLLLVASAVAECGVNPAVVRFASAELAAGRPAGGVARFGLGVKLAAGAAVMILGAVLTPLLAARHFPAGGAGWAVFAAFAGALAAALGSLASSIFIAWQQVLRELLIRGAATLLRVGIVLAVVLLPVAPRWPAAAIALALTPILHAALSAPFLPRDATRGESLTGAARADFLRLAFIFGGAGALWVAATYLPGPITFARAGKVEAAHFYLASQLVLPATVLLTQYLMVMSARVSRAVSAEEARHLQRRSLPFLALLVLALGLVFAGARPAMSLLWSETYASAAPVARGLLCAAALQVIAAPIEMLIFYHKLAGLSLLMNLLCAGAAAGLAWWLAPAHGAAAAAWGFAASFAVSRLIALGVLARAGLLGRWVEAGGPGAAR
jgi:O-antigen/teichoic acid export membrane protein